MNECVLTFKSQTAAAKAARYLKKTGTPVRIVSIDPSVTARGCGWGIAVECASAEEIGNILDSKKIPYGEVLSGGI